MAQSKSESREHKRGMGGEIQLKGRRGTKARRIFGKESGHKFVANKKAT